MAGILKDDGYGVYSITYQIFSFIYIIATSGIPVAISKYVSELSKNNYHKTALRTLKIARSFLILIGFALAVLMAAFSSALANAMHTPEAALGILAISPCIFFTAVLSAYRGYFQGRRQMTPTAVTQIIEQIMNLVFSISFAAILYKTSLEAGVAGGTVGTSVGAFAALVIIMFIFKNYMKNGFAVPGSNVRSPYKYNDIVKTLAKYSLPITFCAAVQYGGNLVDAWNTKGRLMASGLSGYDANVQYGFLFKSQQLINVPVSLAIALAIAMLPAIAESISVGDRNSAREKIRYGLRLCYIVSIPFAFGSMILNGSIYRILFFKNGSEILLYGALTLIFLATAQIQTSILQGINRLYYVIFSLAAGIAVKIGLNYFLIAIPSIRIYGAIIGTFVSMSVTICINQYIINKKEHLGIRLSHVLWRPLAASIYMAAAAGLVYYIPHRIMFSMFSSYIGNLILTIISVIVGVMVYFIIMAKLRGLTKKDLNSISGKIYKVLPGFMKRMLV